MKTLLFTVCIVISVFRNTVYAQYVTFDGTKKYQTIHVSG